MLDQISRVFLCLFIGEVLSRSGALPVPGSVIGLMLLFLDLCRVGELPSALGSLADNTLALLGLLFVPAGVGVLAYQDLLRLEWVPIVAAVVGGTSVALAATTISAAVLAKKEARRQDNLDRGATDAPL